MLTKNTYLATFCIAFLTLKGPGKCKKETKFQLFTSERKVAFFQPFNAAVENTKFHCESKEHKMNGSEGFLQKL